MKVLSTIIAAAIATLLIMGFIGAIGVLVIWIAGATLGNKWYVKLRRKDVDK